MINKEKKDLKENVFIDNTTMKKLGNTKNIVIEVLAKICAAMSCTLDNIVEMVPEDNWR